MVRSDNSGGFDSFVDFIDGINMAKYVSISSAEVLVAPPATTPLIRVSPSKPNR